MEIVSWMNKRQTEYTKKKHKGNRPPEKEEGMGKNTQQPHAQPVMQSTPGEDIMDKLKYEPAQKDDIQDLINISISAFHSDYEFSAQNETGGPPGYDSVDFHSKMLRVSEAFYKILFEDRIIGGIFIFQKSETHMELGRIFIDPEYFRKGIGTRSINYLFKKYPHIKRWTLDTPKWNVRTKNFYERAGFQIEHEDNEFYYFSKDLD